MSSFSRRAQNLEKPLDLDLSELSQAKSSSPVSGPAQFITSPRVAVELHIRPERTEPEQIIDAVFAIVDRRRRGDTDAANNYNILVGRHPADHGEPRWALCTAPGTRPDERSRQWFNPDTDILHIGNPFPNAPIISTVFPDEALQLRQFSDPSMLLESWFIDFCVNYRPKKFLFPGSFIETNPGDFAKFLRTMQNLQRNAGDINGLIKIYQYTEHIPGRFELDANAFIYIHNREGEGLFHPQRSPIE